MTISPFAPGAPCWADIAPTDMDVARAFYSAVLGWDIPPGGEEFGGYTTASVGDAGVAGLMPNDGSTPTAWTLYFASPDADATCEAILAAGGSVIVPTTEVGDFGRMVIAADPTGAVFGVWESNTMIGFEVIGQPGGFAWCDLRSTNPPASQDFFVSVFGYSLAPVEMAPDDYATFAVTDGTPLGGIGPMMGLPDGVPPHWVLYFAVADADAAAEAVASNGGSVHVGPFDSPFGRMVAASDPVGASFWLVQLPG